MWSLGALLELDDRAKLEEFIKKKAPQLEIPPVKDDETIFEYMVRFTVLCKIFETRASTVLE